MNTAKKNSFYKEATECICSSLDILVSLEMLLHYLQKSMPLQAIILALGSPRISKSFEAQIGKLNGKQVKFLKGHDFSDVESERLNYLHIYLGDEAKFAICNSGDELPAWVKKIMSGDGYPQEIKGSHSYMVGRLVLSGNNLGIMWLVGKENVKFTAQDLELISMLHNPMAIALSSRMMSFAAETYESKFLDERRISARNVEISDMQIIGSRTGLRKVLEQVRNVAPTGVSVLIQGETGTGKEVVAKAIHKLSDKRENPFIAINCAALPEQLLESELFGHSKGAFTGASSDHKGYFEIAHNGTIFFDEITELSIKSQVKLLRVLQESEISRVGETKLRKIKVRIIAATNCDIRQEVANGNFREDLYYRLYTFPIFIPPLRERREDILELVYYFAREKSKAIGKDVNPILVQDEIQALMNYDWRGNVRELENAVERAIICSSDGNLHFDLGFEQNIKLVHDDRKNLDINEANRQIILQALQESRGRISGKNGAAQLLHINPNTLRNRMDKLKIEYKNRAPLI